jgi:hypothetical protein
MAAGLRIGQTGYIFAGRNATDDPDKGIFEVRVASFDDVMVFCTGSGGGVGPTMAYRMRADVCLSMEEAKERWEQ